MTAPDTLSFRNAILADAAAIRDLTRRAYAKWIAVIGREPLPMTADYEAAVSGHVFILAEARNQLAGLVEYIPEADGLLIENLAVDPIWQGKGLGAELLSRAEAMCVEMGKDRVRLYTNEMFDSSIRFYLRRGYRETSRGVIVPGSVTVFMERSLGA